MERIETTKVCRSLCVVFLVSILLTFGATGWIAAQDGPGELHHLRSVTELDLTSPEGAFQEHSTVEVTIDEYPSTTEIQPGDNATVEAIVENTGEVAQAVDVELLMDGGNFDNALVDKQTVEVEGGDSQRVPFAIQLDEEGDYEATVNGVDYDSVSTTITVDEDADPAPAPGVPPAPSDPGETNIQVTEAGLSADQISVGGDVDVTATLENLGGESGRHSVSVTTDREEVTSETVSLDAGEETSLTFTETFETAGKYAIAVDGTRAGTLTVGSADLQILSAGVNETEIEPATTVEVGAVVENQGNVIGETTLELVIDGEAVDSQSVSVRAGASDPVTFEHAFEEEGEYEVTINDASAGSVTVSADDESHGIPGFGPVVAVIALAALVAAGRLRAE